MGKNKYYDEEEREERYSRPSRSQLKRESHDLQQLGMDFAALGKATVKRMGLPQLVEDALLRISKITKHEARRRHLQYVGKLMRTVDPEPIRELVNAAKEGHATDTALFHRLETLRERLIAGDDDLLQELFEAHPEEGRQIRQLTLAARREAAKNKPPKSARALFKLLKSLPEPKEN